MVAHSACILILMVKIRTFVCLDYSALSVRDYLKGAALSPFEPASEASCLKDGQGQVNLSEKTLQLKKTTCRRLILKSIL